MTDLQHTDSRFNKYFQDRRIRRYLISAGFINRHGDILPPSAEQVSLARRVTQQQIDDNQAKKEEQNHPSTKRSRRKKTKDSKETRRDTSRSLSDTHRSSLPTNKKPVPKRAKSAHIRSQDSVRIKSPVKDRCRVVMKYYGPRTNFDYDNCWFKPNGDEIVVLQQHCGGENLTVFKGYLKPNDTFAFESRRHPEYPFALSLYVNGYINSRISVCCEYKHKRNVPLDGKEGLFGICDVQKITPCSNCQRKRRKKKLYKDASLATDSSRYQKSIVARSSSKDLSPTREQKLSSSSSSLTPRRRSPNISRTPPARRKELERKPPNPSQVQYSSSDEEEEEDEKKSPVSSTRNVPTIYNSNTHHPTTFQNKNDENYSSDFDASDDNEEKPRVPDSSLMGDQGGRHNSPKILKIIDNDDNEDSDRLFRTPVKKKDIFGHSRKLPTNAQRKSSSSDTENHPYVTRISTDKKNDSQNSSARRFRRSDASSEYSIKQGSQEQRKMSSSSQTTTSDNDTDIGQSFSNEFDRNDKDSQVRRLSTSSAGDLFKNKTTNGHTSSDRLYETTQPNNIDSTHRKLTESAKLWLNDSSPDKDN